jgi:hypothetical protein
MERTPRVQLVEARHGVGDALLFVAPDIGIVLQDLGGQHEDVFVHQGDRRALSFQVEGLKLGGGDVHFSIHREPQPAFRAARELRHSGARLAAATTGGSVDLRSSPLRTDDSMLRAIFSFTAVAKRTGLQNLAERPIGIDFLNLRRHRDPVRRGRRRQPQPRLPRCRPPAS